MSFQESPSRLAVTLRHMRQVMPCSVPLPEWARARSIWLSRRRSSQGNHPTSLLRKRHPYRWQPKLRGREFSPTVTWEKGQTMLIHGGAGAVGAYEAYLKSIGASLVIDYREAQFETVLQE
jgi:hypothetical protein